MAAVLTAGDDNGGGGGGQRQPCRLGAIGKGCKFGKECLFYHDKKIKQTDSASPGGGKAKGKGEPRAPSPVAKAEQTCFRWNLDLCAKLVDECRCIHRKVKPE